MYCLNCFENSFASSSKAIYWSERNIVKPRNVFKSAYKKYIFNCNKCNKEFNTTLGHVTGGKWCPHCINKTEHKVFDEMIIYYPTLQQQGRFKWCKNEETKRLLPFDFVIPEYNIIIELDGNQHFTQVANCKTPEETQLRDKYKMKCANDNGYSMIRITQYDIFCGKYRWIEDLKASIEKIKLEKKVQNIFLCRNDEYKNFQ